MPRRWRVVVYVLIFVALVALALWASATQARAQGSPFDCRVEATGSGGFVLRCEPEPTSTSPPTIVILPTATATPTGTPTSAPTATNTPTPTNTPITVPGPSVTPIAPPVGLRANVPLLDAPEGDPQLDANNWAILWAGKISPSGGYGQLRVVGSRDSLLLYAQSMTPQTTGGFGLSVNGRSFDGRLRDGSGWQWGGTGIGWRGFGAYRAIPWAQLGGRPQPGDVWPLTFRALDGGAMGGHGALRRARLRGQRGRRGVDCAGCGRCQSRRRNGLRLGRRSRCACRNCPPTGSAIGAASPAARGVTA
jgi:hypothetical protein